MESRRYDLVFKNEAKHWWFRGRRKLLERIMQSITNRPFSKILDAGCGSGYNLYILSKYGKVYGYDIEKKAVDYCKMRGFDRIRLLRNGQKLPFKDHQFDIITSLDVIEHVREDLEYLKELHRVLAPGGKLIIFTPAIKLLWGELDIRSHHFRRYSKSSLLKNARKAKFAIKDIRYFNFILFTPILIIRLLQKVPLLKRNDFGADLIVNNKLINNLLSIIFFVDIWALTWFSPPFGVSLQLIAEKKK